MMATAVRSSPLPSSPNSNKRKRGPNDQGNGRDLKVQNTNGADSDFAFINAIQGELNADSAQTAQAALATPMSQSHYPDSFDAAHQLPSFDDGSGTPTNGSGSMVPTAQALYDARQQQSTQKHQVGTVAWHQQRKDNHKEVERRRREVINEGIENIAKIVPGAEKNKGAILARTCVYIQELKTKAEDQATQFDNERRVFDTTLSELTSRHDNIKRECDRAWTEAQKWQQRCRDAGLSFDDYTVGGNDDLQGVMSANMTGDGVTDGFDTGADVDSTSAGA